MNTLTLIPIVPTALNGQASQMVDARVLHTFLEVKRDFSNWIKGRIEEFGFERSADFISFDSANSANQNTRGGDRRSIDYFLTLDMAKELAMVERSAKGRQARRYFLDCERQLRQLQHSIHVNLTRQPMALSHGQHQAINRQAWAAFHARREQLLQECIGKSKPRQSSIPLHLVPLWARQGD